MNNTPVHLRLPYLGLALIGGTFGTAAREALTLLFPPAGGIGYAIFAINILGAFLLGLLLDALVRQGPDEGRRRRVRVMIGTGFLGGFTTYSALALNTANLLGEGSAGAGIVYALGTVILGGLATWAGIATATAAHARAGTATAQSGRAEDATRSDATQRGDAR